MEQSRAMANVVKPFSCDIGYLEYWAQPTAFFSAHGASVRQEQDILVFGKYWREFHCNLS